MGPQRRLGIYNGFESPSLIRKYLELKAGDLFSAPIVDYHFGQAIFQTLRREIK